MTLRIKYIIFVILIHAILLILSFQLIGKHKLLFFPVEILIILSIWISFRLYIAFIRPLNLISTGIKSIKDKDFSTKFVKVGQLEMDQLISVYNQMIDQLREERVKNEEKHFFLEKLINASPSGIILLDFEGKISNLNPTAEKMLGEHSLDVAGKRLDELGSSLAIELSTLDEDAPQIISMSGVHSYKCRKSHFMDRGFQHHFLIIEEITEEIRRTEKKSYEKVIRMMSHEINNSIGAVNSILNSILNYSKQLSDNDRGDYEDALNVAINRNELLNRFMSNFADVVRIPLPVKENCDLNELVRSVASFMKAECDKKSIEIKLKLSEKPVMLELDYQQMEHALVNIIKNAIEAVEENGEVKVETRGGAHKTLIIRDNGRGISKTVQKNLFAPFFSTKKNGQGIGLTLIREILLNHGYSDFSLNTKDDGWTEFRISFE